MHYSWRDCFRRCNNVSYGVHPVFTGADTPGNGYAAATSVKVCKQSFVIDKTPWIG